MHRWLKMVRKNGRGDRVRIRVKGVGWEKGEWGWKRGKWDGREGRGAISEATEGDRL